MKFFCFSIVLLVQYVISGNTQPVVRCTNNEFGVYSQPSDAFKLCQWVVLNGSVIKDFNNTFSSAKVSCPNGYDLADLSMITTYIQMRNCNA